MTCKLIVLWTLNRQAKIFSRITSLNPRIGKQMSVRFKRMTWIFNFGISWVIIWIVMFTVLVSSNVHMLIWCFPLHLLQRQEKVHAKYTPLKQWKQSPFFRKIVFRETEFETSKHFEGGWLFKSQNGHLLFLRYHVGYGLLWLLLNRDCKVKGLPLEFFDLLSLLPSNDLS